MSKMPKPPDTYVRFIRRYPKLEVAWRAINEAGEEGPLDERMQRLVKLAIAIGAMREGAVRASVRKGLAMGITPEEIEQVVALAAGTLGLPSTVSIYSWLRDLLGDSQGDGNTERNNDEGRNYSEKNYGEIKNTGDDRDG